MGFALGCGVTAFSRQDAEKAIQRELLGRNHDLPPIATVIEDVDVSKLDGDHVLPNAGPPNVRGVWFPRL